MNRSRVTGDLASHGNIFVDIANDRVGIGSTIPAHKLSLPDDAKIVKAPTVLLGTGEAISGRIILTSGFSPAENLIFYGTETLSTGWRLISSKVGEEITLVYEKSGRYATIYLAPRGTFAGFIAGDYGSDIDISVVHPDAIGIQNPYEDLNYDNLPESP